MSSFRLVLLFLVVSVGAFWLVSSLQKVATQIKDSPKNYDFRAQSIDGEAKMSSFDGEYKIAYFGYTFCPDVCPTTLGLVSQIISDLGANDRIRVLFFTLDPDRDDVKNCDEYAKYFYERSTCLWMQKSDLDSVVEGFGAKYKKIDLDGSAMQYSVAHSSAIYLFSKNGEFFKEVSNLTYEEVSSAIKELLAR